LAGIRFLPTATANSKRHPYKVGCLHWLTGHWEVIVTNCLWETSFTETLGPLRKYTGMSHGSR